jgi:hypothetical protein
MMPEAITARFAGVPSAAPPTALDHGKRSSWLLCRAGNLLCALPIEHVIEIMRPLPVEQIAGAPHYVRGLSIIRGVAYLFQLSHQPKAVVAVDDSQCRFVIAGLACGYSRTKLAELALDELPQLGDGLLLLRIVANQTGKVIK